uniref:Ral guanine nucleotide dissociation stimulator like 1 n=1 Tax=Bos mutus grunniens TaxID=30521 RepID=A0A8B9XPH0_BOSMU
MLTLSAGFQKGRVCSRAQTGKPDITERRGGVGRSLRRPRSPACSPRSLCGRVARTGGGGRVSVLRARRPRGAGLEALRRRRAGIAFAWERGASCRVHTPERKLRMKLLWQAKMSSIQDWGEEVEEGAVYHVTLKRVQIQQAANKGARWLGSYEVWRFWAI